MKSGNLQVSFHDATPARSQEVGIYQQKASLSKRLTESELAGENDLENSTPLQRELLNQSHYQSIEFIFESPQIAPAII